MNWTEGTLARHSRARKGREVLLRQKDFFAKARAGVLNGNVKSSPPSISVFVQPALASPSSRHSSITKTSAPPYPNNRTRDDSPVGMSRYFRDDDGLQVPTVADFQEDEVEEAVLLQKRRKLLLKGDWTGINLQKPLQMEFSHPRASHGGPWGHSKSRVAKSTNRMRHILGTKNDDRQIRYPKTAGNIKKINSPGQLIVRVGSQERVFGGSANVSPQSKTFREVEPMPQVSHIPDTTNNKTQPTVLTHQDHTSAPDADHQSLKLPELHQPLPQRPVLRSLLRPPSSDPDDATSTKARVGVLEPDVPSSRMETNEAWYSLVNEGEHCQSASDHESSDCEALAVDRMISPGVSHADLSTAIDKPNGQIEFLKTPSAVDGETNVHLEPSTWGQEGFLRSRELEIFRGEFSEDTDNFVTADETRSSTSGSSPFQFKQNSKTSGDVTPMGQSSLTNDEDEVSLQALPTSCSPSSEDLLSHCHNYTDLRHYTDDAMTPSSLLENLSENSQELLELPIQHQNAVTRHGQLPKSSNTHEDVNDNWKDFFHEDSDNGLQKALEQARKETARNLCPSNPSASTGEDEDSEKFHLYPKPSATAAALISDPIVGAPDFASQHNSSSTEISVTAPVSHMATCGDSSPNALSVSDFPNRMIQTDEATVDSSSSPKDVSLGLLDDFLSRGDAGSAVTGGQDNTSLVAHPQSASEHSEADDIFKFARPKSFVGKKVHLDEQRQIALSAIQIRGKGVTRRRQKRTGDGRANIRDVPNFTSDPIEEVEDAVSIKVAQKPHLFDSLDTEVEMF